MRIAWDEAAWEHYVQWLDLDMKTVRKINALVKDCQRTPFTGTGNPEALKRNLRGHWSRRIN